MKKLDKQIQKFKNKKVEINKMKNVKIIQLIG